MNENVSQGYLASQDVAREISEVTKFSTEMVDSSENVKNNAEDFSGLAHRLSEMMEKFKI